MKILLIDHLFSEGPTPKIQRDFWKEMKRKNDLELYVICEPGEFEADFECHKIVVKKQKWVLSFFRILRGFGLRDLSLLPDTYVYSWNKEAYNKALQVCKVEKIDYIYSLSWPCSTHLVAYKLKKKTGLPWVACFYDPWVEHIVKKYRFDYFRRKDAQKERLVAEYADIIIHTNDRMCLNWKDRYGESVANKMKVLPLCLNIDELPAIKSHKRNGKLKIVHIGGVYGNRNSADLVTAIEHLIDTNKDFEEMLEVIYVGDTIERERIKGNKKIGHLFKFTGLLPLNELDTYYDNADIFLLIDMNMRNCPFFPSKLMIYQYYRKPIIGITTEGSVLEQELKEANYPVFYYGDALTLEKYIQKALTHYSCLLSYKDDVWKKYDSRRIAKSFSDIINKLK